MCKYVCNFFFTFNSTAIVSIYSFLSMKKICRHYNFCFCSDSGNKFLFCSNSKINSLFSVQIFSIGKTVFCLFVCITLCYLSFQTIRGFRMLRTIHTLTDNIYELQFQINLLVWFSLIHRFIGYLQSLFTFELLLSVFVFFNSCNFFQAASQDSSCRSSCFYLLLEICLTLFNILRDICI